MACPPVASVAASWIPQGKGIRCSWVDTEEARSKYYAGLEGEPWGPAKPEDLREVEVHGSARSAYFPDVSKYLGKVLRCWVIAVCRDCTLSDRVYSADLPTE